MATREAVDVLILTAIKPEYDAVLDVSDGAAPNSEWVKEPGPTGLEVAFRNFQGRGGPLRVGVTRTLEMGGVAAANAGVAVIQAHQPRVLAMSGVCAGRPGWVELGDVIVADALWKYDAGKTQVETIDGKEVKTFQASTITYNLDPIWKQKAESFSVEGASWLKERPVPVERQAEWLISLLEKGEDPTSHPDFDKECPNYEDVVERLWRRQWLVEDVRELTDEGRKKARRLNTKYVKGLPVQPPFKVHVGPIGTGDQVIQDPDIWNKLASTMRHVLGLEMEAAAIGAMQRLHRIENMLVMKAVMDFANEDKDDHFKPFAARASAECLIKFLRENLVLPQAEAKESSARERQGQAPPRPQDRVRSERLRQVIHEIAEVLQKRSVVKALLVKHMGLTSPEDEPEAVAHTLLHLPAKAMAQVLNYADSSLFRDGSLADRAAAHEILCRALPIAVDWEKVGEEIKAVAEGRNWIDLPFHTLTAAEVVMAGADGRGCRFAPLDGSVPQGAALVHVPAAARTAIFRTEKRMEEAFIESLALRMGAPAGTLEERRGWVRGELTFAAKEAAEEDRFTYYVAFDNDLASDHIWKLAQSDFSNALPNLRLVRVAPGSPEEEVALAKHIAAILLRK